MNIDALLKYQKLDEELFKLEQKLFNSPYKKKANELTVVAKKTQARSTELEAQEEKLIADIAEIKEKYTINKNKSADIQKKNLDEMSMEEVEKYNAVRGKILANLGILEKMLQKCAEGINKILAEFNTTKKAYDDARVQYSVCKQKIEEEAKVLEPEIERLKKELQILEKDVQTEIMHEYKKKRNDKIFPVIVALEGGNFCGRCRMELPKVAISQIKEKGVIVCEHCKRFIYKK